MKPTVGRIVIYKTTEQERKDMELSPFCIPQEELPALILSVDDNNNTNLRIFVDSVGEDDIYASCVSEGKDEGNWHWPVKT